MKRRSSQTFLEEVTSRVLQLKQSTEETGLELTYDLVKTLEEFSELSKSNLSDLSYSEMSEDMNESIPIRQPTNSLLSVPSIDSQTSLITSIKNKNSELQKRCAEKISELRNTTKEFCEISKSPKYKDCSDLENFTQKSESVKKRSKTVQNSCGDLEGDEKLETISREIFYLKQEIMQTNQKIYESNTEIIKQNFENSDLKSRIEFMINQNNNFLNSSCRCEIL